jgi:hypothetical protein
MNPATPSRWFRARTTASVASTGQPKRAGAGDEISHRRHGGCKSTTHVDLFRSPDATEKLCTVRPSDLIARSAEVDLQHCMQCRFHQIFDAVL